MTGHAIMADESVCLDSPTSGNGDPDPGMKQLRLVRIISVKAKCYRWLLLFAVLLFVILTIHIEIKWNLTPFLCSKPGLGIHGFAIHIHKILECNLRWKPVHATEIHTKTCYSVFQGFSKAKSANGGSILSSSQFLILLQLPQKIKLASKVVKVDSKIIISLPKIKIPETHCRRNEYYEINYRGPVSRVRHGFSSATLDRGFVV
jgi:hypothetical protein